MIVSRKKVLPDDVRSFCISLVRGYPRRREQYNLKREELISVTPYNVVKIKGTGGPKDAKDDERNWEGAIVPSSHNASRTTEDVTERILGLEKLPETQYMRAVEYAAKNVGLDLTAKDRKVLVNAIFKSCQQGRKYPFERLGVEGMERSCFYDRRTKFLIDIAKYLGIL